MASTVIDALRRAEVRAAEPLPDEDDEPGSVGEAPIGPDRRAGDVEQMQGLARCLAEIPERRRLPITLHLQGFQLQEIADLAGIRVGRGGPKTGFARAGRTEDPPARVGIR